MLTLWIGQDEGGELAAGCIRAGVCNGGDGCAAQGGCELARAIVAALAEQPGRLDPRKRPSRRG